MVTADVHCLSPQGGELDCYHRDLPLGTIASFPCPAGHKPLLSASICSPNSTWTPSTPCVIGISYKQSKGGYEECGKVDSGLTLINGGSLAEVGQWPWAAGLYVFQSAAWVFICGLTLLSSDTLITAGHCVWKTKPQDLRVTLGNIYQDFDAKEDFKQIHQVKKILFPSVYQDRLGNYGSDLAVIKLLDVVEMTNMVHPICLFPNIYTISSSLVNDTLLTVAGWGLTENFTPSKRLRHVQLPIVDSAKCILEEAFDFRKYITYTTICAGYRNGTSVCNGDSGSGFVFFDGNSWSLVGVVSVSPRKRGTSFCNPSQYSLLTKIESYIPWLRKVLSSP